jgi:hypothetical protein
LLRLLPLADEQKILLYLAVFSRPTWLDGGATRCTESPAAMVRSVVAATVYQSFTPSFNRGHLALPLFVRSMLRVECMKS